MSTSTWSRCDIPPIIIPTDGAISIGHVASNTPSDTHYTIYGPGELETYRHAELRRSVHDAKLKVFYPGSWRDPSPRAAFRASLSCNSSESTSTGERKMFRWKFRSNARIVSAHLERDRRGDVHNKEHHVEKDLAAWGVGWDPPLETSVRTSQNGRFYDCTIFLPMNIAEASFRTRLLLELDTRPMHSGNDGSSKENFSSEPNDDRSLFLENEENESHLYPPPCISLQVTNSLQDFANQLLFESWEWRRLKDNHDGEEIDSEWCGIHQCWTSDWPFETGSCDASSSAFSHSSREQNSTSTHTNSSDAENAESCWVFPHHMALCHVESLLPQAVIPLPDRDERGGDSFMECLYDFGKELLGKVEITVLSTNDVKPFTYGISSVKLRAGETVAEAMNDDEEHFEQSTELRRFSSDDATSCARDAGFGKENSLVFISVHLLAFRYARIVIEGFDKSANELLVECHSQKPRVTMEGGLSFETDSTNNAPATEPNSSDELLPLDHKIWRCSAYTLQLCMYHNFIVDGIKRDRLPWAGDLAVSVMANSYSFSDVESIRFSLAVLGRCGIDAMPRDDGDRERLDHATQNTFMRESHVNGIVDFSLWYVISHWLYQRYFGDVAFLKQEWAIVTKRLSSLIKFCTDVRTGRLITNDKNWVFIDWSDSVEKTTALQILWWWALECSSLLVDTLISLADDKTSADHEEFSRLIRNVKSRLESFFVEDDVQHSYSRHAHILGVLSGLNLRLVDNASSNDWWNPDLSDDRWRSLVKVRKLDHQSRDALLGDELECVGTPFMKHLECLAISRLGERSSALDRVRNYWGGMLRAGATTFYEAFAEHEKLDDIAKFYKRPFARSLCHAWGSGPCALLPEVLLGLRPIADGWKVFSVDPLDECPAVISSSVKTKHGVIKVDLDPTMLRIFIPQGTTMVLMERSYGPGSHCFLRAKLLSSQTVHQWSKKYRGWFHHPRHIIPNNPQIPVVSGWENIIMTDVPTVYQIPGDKKYYISFVGFDGSCYRSFVAESTDLLSWTGFRLAMGCKEGGPDEGGVVLGAYLYECYDIKAPRVLKRVDGRFYSLYGAYSKKGGYEIDPGHQGLAASDDGLFWVPVKNESILSIYGPGTVGTWEKDSIYQPWLLEHDGTYYNFYNAKQMPQWVEQIGIATSKNLREWKRHEDNPILRVDTVFDSACPGRYDTQFCSDAKVFFDYEVNHWVMFYFGVGKGGAHIMIAFSKDLLHWIRDPEPVYYSGDNPSGLDKSYAHKISILYSNETWYIFYCAVGDAGRGIGLLTSQ